jgi:hypothetical protein
MASMQCALAHTASQLPGCGGRGAGCWDDRHHAHQEGASRVGIPERAQQVVLQTSLAVTLAPLAAYVCPLRTLVTGVPRSLTRTLSCTYISPFVIAVEQLSYRTAAFSRYVRTLVPLDQ